MPVNAAYTIYLFLNHHCTNSLSSLHIFVHHCTFCASLHTKTSPARYPSDSLGKGTFIELKLHNYFIIKIYVAPLQGYYSEVPPTPARLKKAVEMLEYNG